MTSPDIVLVQSQRLTDNPNGGGQMTATVIPDNQANNLFGPISRVNRADGNVSLRKAIAKAITNDTAVYYGAHQIISAPPTNSAVEVLMFYTGSWTDQRVDAINQIENYLVQGPQTRMWLYGQHVAGQKSIIVYQPVGLALPLIGYTYVLNNNRDTSGNLLATPNTQFIRIDKVSSEIQTFTDAVGTFQLNIITIGITAPLASNFNGVEAQRYSTPPPPTVLCTTNVANAATYYGVMRPAADIAAGDETCMVDSIFGQLLPSTEGESPVSSVAAPGKWAYVPSGPAYSTTSFNILNAFPPSGYVFYLPVLCMPGTFTISWVGRWAYADDGKGNIIDISGNVVGSIDYDTARITCLNGGAFNNGNNLLAVSFRPATRVSQAGYYKQQAVTESTRGYVYVDALTPLPTPGSLTVSYCSNGRWYDLTDDGSGTLVGAAGTGTGTVRFDSGAMTVTLGALPDIGTSIVYSWGTYAEYDIRTSDTAIQAPAVPMQLSHPAKPGTVTISWTVGATNYSVTDGAGTGLLTGSGGTGTISYDGVISLKPTALPAPSVGFTVTYQTNPVTSTTFNPTRSAGVLGFTIPGAPLAPRSVAITFNLHYTGGSVYATLPTTFQVTLYDDGAGNLVAMDGQAMPGATINYSTGAVSFAPDRTGITSTPVYSDVQQVYWTWTYSGSTATPHANTYPSRGLTGYTYGTYTLSFTDGSPVVANAVSAGASSTAQSDNFPAPSLRLDLNPTSFLPVVPGSIMFTYAGDTYVDRSGTLYRAISVPTNAGIPAGTMNYETGIATITDWIGGGSQTLSVKALLVQYLATPIGSITFRTPGSTIRPASFIVQFNRISDSTLVTATADNNGLISTADVTGGIDTSTGIVTLFFGQKVLDSSLTSTDKAQPWYNPANVDGTGHIWRPNEAVEGSIKYSCVVLTHLPLSANVIGIDPVRLPSDGRVVKVKAGNTLVFRNPLIYTFTGTVSGGSTTALPRGDLESAVLYDQAGTRVDIGLYTSDLATGSVSIVSGADLSSYTQPFVCKHTQGELALCTDTQITGAIAIANPLVHDYPAATSYISTALIADNAGNLQATYSNLFDQTTWNFNPNNIWSDTVQGTAALASYNDVNYPIQVNDHDTITQRVMLQFTSSTGGNIVFEEIGIVGTFTTSANVAPINQATGNPIFTMDYHGFGTGWANGNCIRFNLTGAGLPHWYIRSVQVGAPASLDDAFETETRWDK